MISKRILGLAVAEEEVGSSRMTTLASWLRPLAISTSCRLGDREIADLLRHVDGKSEVGYDPLRFATSALS
ncbi:hypothetical protein F2981_22085 (plasmid) [Sinorhizobium meliloti]|nr:hypothetical protein [Sinorhizobium meliloti]